MPLPSLKDIFGGARSTSVPGAALTGPRRTAVLLFRLLAWLTATAAVALLTWALILLHADNSTAGILFLLIIVWAATFASSVLAIYLAVLAALLFDYFFLEPLYTLNLSSFQEWLSMLAFLVSCVVVNRVAERARRETRKVEQRREDAERLYALSQEMMLHDDAAGLVRDIPRLVEKNFALTAVLLYVRAEDQLFSSGFLADSLEGTSDKSEVSDPDAEEDPINAQLREQIRASFQAISAALESTPELPAGFTSHNLVFGMNSVGTLAWKPATLTREMATSVAAQVAIAITRAHAIERSARLEAARSADRLRSALIDSLTHELRTPLTAIRAAATSLVNLDGLDDETRTELAAIVDEESARLDRLIGEAMEVAEIESGVRVKLAPVRVSTFLESAVQTSQAQLANHQVKILACKPETPVWLDPHVLGRVLRHLLENAARYTPPGTQITLSCKAIDDRLEFRVEDNGPGIDSRDIPLIFDKFYRGRQRMTGNKGAVKGSGMGLAIARALMIAHNGGIEVAKVSGRGAGFRLWVPLTQTAPAE
jgi:two-component system sensor histidine kinase KdpD